MSYEAIMKSVTDINLLPSDIYSTKYGRDSKISEVSQRNPH